MTLFTIVRKYLGIADPIQDLFQCDGASRDPVINQFLYTLSENDREAFEERVAIIEFDGGKPCDVALAMAMEMYGYGSSNGGQS